MFKKAIETLIQNMTKDELVKLHEQWDGDAYNSFFHEFSDQVERIAPEVFSDI